MYTLEQVWHKCLQRRTVSESGCWLYEGKRDKDGYGMCNFQDSSARVHRLALMVTGELKDGDRHRLVCHSCDQPACFNPEHLFVGTQKDNIRDCVAKLRQHEVRKTHCPKGHAYTPENTYRNPNSGNRMCRQCRHEYWKTYRRKTAVA